MMIHVRIITPKGKARKPDIKLLEPLIRPQNGSRTFGFPPFACPIKACTKASRGFNYAQTSTSERTTADRILHRYHLDQQD